MNEAKNQIQELNDEQVITKILDHIIRPEAKWNIQNMGIIQTYKSNHSILEDYEFLFKVENQISIFKSCEEKPWFLYEDYQLKLTRFIKQTLKSTSKRNPTGPKTIYRFVLNCDNSSVEIVCVLSHVLEYEIQSLSNATAS